MPLIRTAHRSTLAFVCVLVTGVVLVFGTATVGSQSRGERRTVLVNGREAVAGEVLVQFDRPLGTSAQQQLVTQIDAEESVPVGRHGLRRFRSRGLDVETLMAFFRVQPDVAFVEPNYIVRAQDVPDDPSFPSLWGLQNTGQVVGGLAGTPGVDIDAVPAWDVSTGSASTVVGVIDSGIDYNHPDLVPNLWSAPSSFTVTVGGSSITCAAGTHGYNAILRTCDPLDDRGHGTHVSGTIGASGSNGQGVTGVNWTTRIISGKFLNSSGNGTTSDAIDAIDFMVQVKLRFAGSPFGNIRVLNNSWGGGGFSTALRDAIARAQAQDMLFVAAAGNNGNNNDLLSFYPASYTVPNVIAVAATDHNDQLAWFSNYGAASVHLSAPGVGVYSTVRGGSYDYSSGTSMASPHVAGAAALMLSVCSVNTAALKSLILGNVDSVAPLTGVVNTAGRLNVNRAIRACAAPTIPSPPTDLFASGGNRLISLAWSASPGASSYTVKRSMTAGGPYAPIAAGVTSSQYVDDGLTVGTPYYYVVSAVNGLGESADSAEASAVPLEVVPLAPTKLKAAPGDSRVTLTWLPSNFATSYTVKRRIGSSGAYSGIADVTALSFTDTSVSNGTTYQYVVTAENSAGESRNSNRVSAMPAPVPAPPANFAAVSGPNIGEITLSWNASPWAVSYKVSRSTVSGGPYSGTLKSTGLTVTDDGRRSGRRFYYIVRAVNASGESGPSVEVSAVAR